MKTFRFKSNQDTAVIDVMTDSVSADQDNQTIHDIKFVKGNREKLTRAGFSYNIPDVVDKQKLIKVAEDYELDLDVYNKSTDNWDHLNIANVFDQNITLGGGREGEYYSEDLSTMVDHNVGDVEYEISDGDLPDGLEIYRNTIVGTPTTAGASTFKIKMTDSADQVLETLNIVVTILPPATTS